MIESVRLFVERAQAVRPAFQVTSSNAPAVAELCDRLEGIPLAIELAAARAQIMTPAQMLAQLTQRFEFLVSRKRDVTDRHRTLRATIDWSYHLLSENIQRFFAQLSVFRGGWTLEAATSVCLEGSSEESEWIKDQALDYLQNLQERSLVLTEESEVGMRFRMLETLREYADEQLSSMDRTAIRQRHRDFFLALVEEAGPALKGSQQVAWFNRLEAEQDNLRAALDWQADEACMRMAGTLGWFWYVRGYFSEGRDRLARVLRETAGLAHPAARAKALDQAGLLASQQGRYTEAQTWLEESLALFRELGDKQGIASALNNLAQVCCEQGNYLSGQMFLEESLALLRELQNKQSMADALQNLGKVATDQGDYAQAKTLYEESLALRRELPDKRGLSSGLMGLGILAHNQEEYATARTLYEESLALFRELRDPFGIANALSNLGLVYEAQEEYAAAQELQEESLALLCKLGDKFGIAYVLEALASLAAEQGQTQRAAQIWGAAEALRENIQSPLPPSLRAIYDSQVAAARDQSNGKTFEDAWIKGRSMTMEQAIDLALNKNTSD